MELADDLKSLLTDFSSISMASEELVEENKKLRDRMDEKEKRLLEAVTLSTRLEKDLQRKQGMLEMVHQQLVVIPELRRKVDGLTETVMMLEKMSTSKDQDLSRLKQKHLADLNSLKEEIEKEREESRDEENKRMKELEEFFRQAQETELASMEKKGEREKQVTVEQLKTMEAELQRVKAEQEEELEMMRVQIISAKGKANQAVPNSSEIYRKKMMAMQEHYEKQIQELIAKNQSSEGSVKVDVIPESSRKKKKVSFAPESLSANNVAEDAAIAPIVSNDTTEDTYESIFAVAANRFSRAKPSNITDRKDEGGVNGRKKTSGIIWDRMGDDGGQDARQRTMQPGKAVQANPTMSMEKPHSSRFKFSSINSGMFGAATEFGKFSAVSGAGGQLGHDRGGLGHGYSGQAGGNVGMKESRLGEQFAGPGGMKRKLFSESTGPQVLE